MSNDPADAPEPTVPTMSRATEEKVNSAREAAIADPRSSQGLYDLPCGYLELAPGGQPVLHREAHVVEIDGDAEDMLGSKSVAPHLKFGQLIAMCTRRVGPYTDAGAIAGTIMPALTIGDRAFLLLQSRRVSLGDQHYQEEFCENPDCLDPRTLNDPEPRRSQSLYTVDLSDIDIKPMPNPLVRSYTAEIQHRGETHTAVFHPMTGADEGRIARYKTDTASMAILARLDQWNGKDVALRLDGHNAAQVLGLVKSFGLGIRNALRDHFGLVEGGIDTTLQLTCPLCKTSFERELRIDVDFFRPSAVLQRWKGKSPTSSTGSTSPRGRS